MKGIIQNRTFCVWSLSLSICFQGSSMLQPGLALHSFLRSRGIPCLANGFQPQKSSLWMQCDQRNDSRTFLEWKGYTQLYFHGGRSITRIPSTQSESACSKPVPASGPLYLKSRPILCRQHCHHSSLCYPATLQPCHHVSQSTGHGSLYRVNNSTVPTHVEWAGQLGPGENPGHRNVHFIHIHYMDIP